MWLFSRDTESLATISLWSCDEYCQAYHKRLDHYCHHSLLAKEEAELDKPFVNDWDGLLPSDIAENFDLQQVHVLARHGDRSPMHQQLGTFPVYYDCNLNFSNGWHGVHDFHVRSLQFDGEAANFRPENIVPRSSGPICSRAMLTAQGFHQHRTLGSLLASRYFPQLFVNIDHSQQIAQHIYVQSTDRMRTIESAGAFMLGFLPRDQNLRRKVTIHVSPGTWLHAPPPWILQIFTKCKNLHSFSSAQLWKTNYHQVELTKYMPTFELLLSIFKQPSLKRLPPREVFDSVVTRGCHVRENPLPCSSDSCLDYENAVKLFEYVDWVSTGSYTHLSASLGAIPFLRHSVYETAADVVQHRDNAKKFLLSVAHDTTMTGYLVALGINIQEWMPYASRVTFELWKSSSKIEGFSHSYYIRVLYNGTPITDKLLPWKNKESKMLHRELLPFSDWESFLLTGDYRDLDSYSEECSSSHSLR